MRKDVDVSDMGKDREMRDFRNYWWIGNEKLEAKQAVPKRRGKLTWGKDWKSMLWDEKKENIEMWRKGMKEIFAWGKLQ